MSIKIGINGFGRIGRNIFRALHLDPLFADIELVGINDLTDVSTLKHLMQYDSIMGQCTQDIQEDEGGIRVNGTLIPVTGFRQPQDILWQAMGAEYVLECTGKFRDRATAQGHLLAGASKVILSAPAKNAIKTIVMGINEDSYDPLDDHLVSNASCTTNCLAPVAQVILDNFGIKRGFMTTIHAYTGDQSLIDAPHSDLRRARAAGLSMIPTVTGAAAAVSLVIPELKGRFDGLAVRVPTATVSLVDVVMEVERETGVDEVNQAFAQASSRYLGYTDEPLVSVDFQGDSRSSIVDGQCTRVMGTTVKVMSWYDNEWAYANRMLDLVLHMHASRIV